MGTHRQVKATSFPQFPLPLSNHTGVDDVPDAILANKQDLLAAINLCIAVSGYQDQQVAEALGISETQLSKYKSGLHNFPPNSLLMLMKFCGNLIPLRWLALKAGQKIEPLLSTLEQERDAQKARAEEAERRLDTITKFLQQVGMRLT